MIDSQEWVPIKTVWVDGRECRVHYSAIDGCVREVTRKVDVRRTGGTGFGWRRLPLDTGMAAAAIAIAESASLTEAKRLQRLFGFERAVEYLVDGIESIKRERDVLHNRCHDSAYLLNAAQQTVAYLEKREAALGGLNDEARALLAVNRAAVSKAAGSQN